MEGLRELDFQTSEKILLCRGDIFDDTRYYFVKKGIEFRASAIEGELQTALENRFEKYLEEIGGFSPLKPDDEIDLARRIRRGDEEALDMLVKANLRFVISVAKEYQGQGLPLQDLISEETWD